VEPALAQVTDVGHPCCKRCTRFSDYARTVADQIGLRDWIVQVAHEPPLSAARATAQIAQGRRLIQLRFADDEEYLPLEEMRHDFVHELAHALVEDLWQTVRVGIEDELSGAAYRVYISQVQRELERLVDVMATGLAARVPLP